MILAQLRCSVRSSGANVVPLHKSIWLSFTAFWLAKSNWTLNEVGWRTLISHVGPVWSKAVILIGQMTGQNAPTLPPPRFGAGANRVMLG